MATVRISPTWHALFSSNKEPWFGCQRDPVCCWRVSRAEWAVRSPEDFSCVTRGGRQAFLPPPHPAITSSSAAPVKIKKYLHFISAILPVRNPPGPDLRQ